jgi:hypothetical protein
MSQVEKEMVQLGKMEAEAPSEDEVEEIELDEEEMRANILPLQIPITAFPTMVLTLRMKISGAVGEVMQYVEMSSLSLEAQKAMKDSIKRSIWSSVGSFIKSTGELSGIPDELIREVTYTKDSEKGGWATTNVDAAIIQS